MVSIANLLWLHFHCYFYSNHSHRKQQDKNLVDSHMVLPVVEILPVKVVHIDNFDNFDNSDYLVRIEEDLDCQIKLKERKCKFEKKSSEFFWLKVKENRLVQIWTL